MKTNTELTGRNRYARTVAAVAQHRLDRDATTVRRVAVTDETDGRIPVLVTPEQGPPAALEPGNRHRVTGPVGGHPSREADSELRCPECGALRAGRAADAVDGPLADPIEQWGTGGPFGIVTEETAVTRVPGDDGVDDRRLPGRLDEHERESVPLAVSGRWADTFGSLRGDLAAERDALGDRTPDRELDLPGQLQGACREAV